METEDTSKSEGLDNPEVFEKYKFAAQIANEALATVYKEAVVGKTIYSLCELGDNIITEKLKHVYKKKKDLLKGIAFPTCVSINEQVCHNSPSKSEKEEENVKLQDNDVVRIDLAVHVDGYIATVATTKILTNSEIINGKAADVFAAADVCHKAAIRLLKSGHSNKDITKLIHNVCETFKVNPAEGVLSHQLKRFVIDGSRCIIQKLTGDHDVDDVTFKDFEVYGLDIVITSGEGKFKETEPRTTIFKRDEEVNAQIKRDSSIKVLKEIKEKHENFPFNISSLDQKVARLGIAELKQTNMVVGYPVLCEKPKNFVIHIKSTILITPKEIVVATGHEIQKYHSEYKPDDETMKLFNGPLKFKLKKKKDDKKDSTKKEDKMDEE